MTEVDMVNDLFNPFPSGASQFFFLDTDINTISEHNSEWTEADEDFTIAYANNEINVLDFSITVKLGNMIQILERTRYNFWDLLGDVGGFNDGLHLVGSLLLSGWAAFSFKQSILKNVKVDVEALKKNNRTAPYENSAYFQTIIKKINDQNETQCKVDADMISVFKWGLKRAINLKHSFLDCLKELCQKSKKNKRKKFENRIMDRIDRQLDIRNLIESNVTLNMVIRRTMTKQQRQLLSFQRDTLPAGIDSPSSSDSSAGSDFETSNKRDPEKVEKLLKNLHGFVIETDFDRRLLTGLVKRDYPIKGSNTTGMLKNDVDKKGRLRIDPNNNNDWLANRSSAYLMNRSEEGTPIKLIPNADNRRVKSQFAPLEVSKINTGQFSYNEQL